MADTVIVAAEDDEGLEGVSPQPYRTRPHTIIAVRGQIARTGTLYSELRRTRLSTSYHTFVLFP